MFSHCSQEMVCVVFYRFALRSWITMSAVTSKLSGEQERKLCSMLGSGRLSLLFKASVHGYTADAFHRKCDRQGPTVTVAYNNSGYIFGAYTSRDYAQTNQNIADEKAFLFSFNEKEKKRDPLRVISGEAQPSHTDGATGPNFISLVFLHNNTATVSSNPGTYQFDPVEMHGNDLQLTECEVYRVEGEVPNTYMVISVHDGVWKSGITGAFTVCIILHGHKSH